MFILLLKIQCGWWTYLIQRMVGEADAHDGLAAPPQDGLTKQHARQGLTGAGGALDEHDTLGQSLGAQQSSTPVRVLPVPGGPWMSATRWVRAWEQGGAAAMAADVCLHLVPPTLYPVPYPTPCTLYFTLCLCLAPYTLHPAQHPVLYALCLTPYTLYITQDHS